MWLVDLELITDWLDQLDEDSYDQFIAAVEILRETGPTLGRPLVDTVVGSSSKNMKELRPGSRGRSEIRALFIFDPTRTAIVLVAGDKSSNWKRWYRTNIPIAEERYEKHLENLETDR